MEGSVTNTRRPFHETIVESIRKLPDNVSNDEILRLLELIITTVIPANHNAIDDALRELGREKEITLEPASEIEALRESKIDRRSLRVDLRRTIESVRDQKVATPVVNQTDLVAQHT